jgi:hypothetical protein
MTRREKLLAIGETAYLAASRKELAEIAGSYSKDGSLHVNGIGNVVSEIAEKDGWKHPSLRGERAVSNSAIEHKASMAISATFKTAWQVHMSACDGMPTLFAQETPELIVCDKARNWLQVALLADKPNQFVLSCSMANQTTLESDFRFIGVESKAMRESRLTAERAQRERDAIYISGLERQGFIVISPDNTVPTGIAASLNRLETIVAGIVDKSAELAELKAIHKKLSGGIDKLTGDDLAASRAKLASIENECANLAERIRRAKESATMIAGVDHAGNLVSVRERIGAWIDTQEQTIAKFGPLANKANDLASKVIPPSQQFTPEQETKIAGVMTALDCSRDEAIATMKAKGKL